MKITLELKGELTSVEELETFLAVLNVWDAAQSMRRLAVKIRHDQWRDPAAEAQFHERLRPYSALVRKYRWPARVRAAAKTRRRT